MLPAIPLERIEGKYEILGKLGEGGMGAVYKVRHKLLNEIRVIKVMRPQLASAANLAARFIREARAATQLRHPNIAQLYDFSLDEDGYAFMVMEYIDGLNLQEMLQKKGPLPLGFAMEISQQALRALGFLHGKGFIHRDVSPDNLMLTKNEEGGLRVKLIDLGIAKALEAEAGGAGATLVGMFLGKVRYAPPEQFKQGAAAVDLRGDLYSFGLVLYELLTGRYPIQGGDASAIIAGHLFFSPLDFAESDPTGRVPEDLRQVVLKVLSKDPGDRFAGAQELSHALEPFHSKSGISEEDLDLTLQPVPSPEGTSAGGSTQFRLDAQFKLQTTPTPYRLSESGETDHKQTLAAEGDKSSLRTETVRLDLRAEPPSSASTVLLPLSPLQREVRDPGTPSPAGETRKLDIASMTPQDSGTSSGATTPAVKAQPAVTEPPPPAMAEVPAGREAALPLPVSATSIRSQNKRLLSVAAVLALAAVLFLGVLFVRKSRQTPQPPAPPKAEAPVRRDVSPPPVTPAQPTPPLLNPQIQRAEDLLAAGDVANTRLALAAISAGETLSPEERDRVQRVRDTLALLESRQAADALSKALGAGDPKLLRTAVAAISKDLEASLDGTAKRNLARARQLIDLDARLARAVKGGQSLDIVRKASALLAEQPRNAQAAKAREQAAEKIEADFDAKAQAGQLDTAVAQLQQLRDAWPNRRGISETIDRLKAEQSANQETEDLLAAVAQAEQAGKPQEALQLLANAVPNERYAERFRETKARLERQIEQLDQGAPAVTLAVNLDTLSYKKGEVIRIPLRISDDMEVASVEGWARSGKGSFVKLTVRLTEGGNYEMKVPADLHQNKGVDFYVVATDRSGHKGRLGDAGHPLRIKGKGLLSRF